MSHGVLRTAVVTHDCAGVTNGRWGVRLAKRVDARTMRLGMGEQKSTRKNNNTKCYLFCLESKASKTRRNLGEFAQMVGGEDVNVRPPWVSGVKCEERRAFREFEVCGVGSTRSKQRSPRSWQIYGLGHTCIEAMSQARP